MYTRILVPLDRSELAEQVLPYVRLLGNKLPVPLDLLHVVDPSFSYMADFAHGLHPDQPASIAVSRAQEYLDQLSASLKEEGLTVSAKVLSVYGESPASGIVSEADTVPGTLITMSTHGRSGLTRWALGSVADRAVRRSNGPVLIIRAAEANSN